MSKLYKDIRKLPYYIKVIEQYDKFNSILQTKNWEYKNLNNRVSGYDFPKFLHDDIMVLNFLYDDGYKWRRTDIKTINNYIKRKVKVYVLNSILKKFERNVEYYSELKDFLDKKPNFNNPGSFDYVGQATKQNIYYMLHAAIKKTPDWIKDSIKYNL